jgi:hypothetical protein
MNRTHKQNKPRPTTNSNLVFKPYVMPSEEVRVDIVHNGSSKAVEAAILKIGTGTKKTTDKKIRDACTLYNVDETRVRIVAGLDKGGMNESKIVR